MSTVGDFASHRVPMLTPTVTPSFAATELIQGRTFDPKELSFVKTLRNECNKNHLCQSMKSVGDTRQRSTIPTRLIDVGGFDGNPDARLCDFTDALPGSALAFVFVSFTWGGARPEIHLNSSTYAELTAKIPTEELPTLHRDAIAVCRELDYRYLWIDTLCFMQDDPDETTREIRQIGTYLTSADIVFVASAESMNEDLLPPTTETLLK